MTLMGMASWHVLWFRERGALAREEYARLLAHMLIDGVRGALTPVQATDVTRIRRAAMHLLTLINEVLNWARPEPAPITAGWQLILVGDVVAATKGDGVAVGAPVQRPSEA